MIFLRDQKSTPENCGQKTILILTNLYTDGKRNFEHVREKYVFTHAVFARYCSLDWSSGKVFVISSRWFFS